MLRIAGVVLVISLGLAGCGATNNAVSSADSESQTVYVDAAGKCAKLAPCFTTIQQAVGAAEDGDTVSVFDGNYELSSADPQTPALTIDKSLTITSFDSDEKDDSCPDVASDCPAFTVVGAINTPIVISADDVEINNIAVTQRAIPGSNPVAAIIHVPNSGQSLVSDVRLSELALVGGRRGIWYSGTDGAVTASVFTDQAKDSIFVPATTGDFNIFDNTFSGGAGKAVLFESQTDSPPTSGNVVVSYNALNGKGNFAVWNSWASGATARSVSYTLDHNTIVGTTGAATAILPNTPEPGLAMFSKIDYSNNIVQGAGGDAIYIDYSYSPNPASVPAPGQIKVINSNTYSNSPSKGTNDPSGNYGYSPGAPDSATIKMFSFVGKNLNNTNPLLTNPAANDFSLSPKSPALGAGTDQTNIGQWQGIRPEVRRVAPSCAVAGSKVVVVAKNVKAKPTVSFGSIPADVVSAKLKKKARITVVVPDGTPGSIVDVTVTDSGGSGTLPSGFRYATSTKKCSNR